jgi:hypothetical protein
MHDIPTHRHNFSSYQTVSAHSILVKADRRAAVRNLCGINFNIVKFRSETLKESLHIEREQVRVCVCVCASGNEQEMQYGR